MQLPRNKICFVLSSPSGGGKSSIAQAIISRDSDVRLSVSVTTRPKRMGEKEGIDYKFVSRSQFEQMINDGELLEYVEVFDHYYGTLKRDIDSHLENYDVMFDVTWHGAFALKKQYNTISIYIIPPSMETLQDRLIKRGDEFFSIEKRIAKAKEDISYYVNYDYIVVNNDFEQSIDAVYAIVTAARCGVSNIINLSKFISWL